MTGMPGHFSRHSPATDFAGLFDERTGDISPAIYTDPGLYELELERIFSSSWLFIAHETQLRKPGDFFSTYMAEDPVIAVRQKDGSVSVLLNQCRHRGMRICRHDSGNARAFTCVYHGWAYDMAGNLVNIPDEQIAYGSIDKSQWGVRRVPRVESHCGLIFANWDADAPSLTDYLGDMAFYLEAVLGRSPAGMEAYGGVFKWIVPANWKLAAEQSCSDMWHGGTTHVSPTIAMMKTGILTPPPPGTKMDGRQYRHETAGHGAGFFRSTDTRRRFHVGLAGELIDGFDPAAANAVAETTIGVDRTLHALQHAVVFPNFAVFDGSTALRCWHPRGPNEFEFWSIGLVPVDADAATREQLRLGNLRGLGPAGTLEQDDGENWVEVQRVLRGYQARQTPFTAQQGLHRPGIGGDPVYPGVVDQAPFSEEAARGFYARWLELVSGSSEHRATPALLQEAAE